MSYFTEDFLRFFKALKKNNTTAWFHENRKLYETAVKEPFKKFVEEMIFRIREEDPEVSTDSAASIFRINKDIRFSKDKTPYNTHVSANISRYGRKGMGYPGFYFQISPEKIIVAGGAYMLEKESLYNLRERIAQNAKEFEKLVKQPAFVKKFATIQGEKNKIIPAEWKEAFQAQPLIANKQFYYMAELPVENITSPKLPALLMEYYRAGRPLHDFIKAAWN